MSFKKEMNLFDKRNVFLISVLLLFILSIFVINTSILGRTILEINSSLVLGEPILGQLAFNIKQGELVPLNSKIKIDYGNQSKLLNLRDLILDETISGEFYAEGVNLSGSGEGYGVIGSVVNYPNLTFDLLVYYGDDSDSETSNESDSGDSGDSSSGEVDVNVSDGNSSISNETSSNESISESNETILESNETVVEGNESVQDEQNVSESEEEVVVDNNSSSSESEIVQEETAEASPQENEVVLTGNVVSQDRQVISGVVSKGNNFEFNLENGQKAKILPGSVRVNGESLPESSIDLKVRNGKAIISTGYFVNEKGFGERFLGEYGLSLIVDLSKLELVAQEGDLVISLVYGDEVIASASKNILLEEEIEVNESNLTKLKDIEMIRLSPNSSFELNLSEYFSGAESYEFEANNITGEFLGEALILNSDGRFKGSRKGKVIAFSGAENVSSEFNILVSSGAISIKTSRSQIKVGEPVKWVQNVSLEIPENVTIELPKHADNVSVKKVEKEEEKEAKADIRGISGNVIRKWGLVGRVIGLDEQAQENSTIEVQIQDNATDYVVEYYTDAPTITEENKSSGKRVIVSGPDELNYTDVLSFTNIEEIYQIGEENKIKLFWVENNTYLPFDVYDLDGNEYLDYMEWITPHLSNQTFEIILITRAEHLDGNRTFVEDIYDLVKERDGNFTNEINPGEYVRVWFEKNLSSSKDITIYAKSNESSRIEVYQKDSNEVLATFENVSEDRKYQILLTNLEGEQDTFDLKVLDSPIQFDYIVDPVANDSSNNIFQCGDILSSGNYQLNQSINTTGTCINVMANGVTIDGNGFNITGDSWSGDIWDIGINVTGFNNVKIKNIIVSSFGEDIRLLYSNNSVIENTTIMCGAWSTNCIFSQYSYDLEVNTSTFTQGNGFAGYGLFYQYGNGFIARNNNFTNFPAYDNIHLHTGIVNVGRGYNLIENNNFENEDVVVTSTKNVLIRNNNFTRSSVGVGLYVSNSLSTNVSVVNNTLNRHTIDFRGENGTIDNNKFYLGGYINLADGYNNVTNNLINGSSQYGIVANGAYTGAYIAHNTIYAPQQDGMLLGILDSTIFNNTINSSWGDGIVMQGKRNLVANNTIVKSGVWDNSGNGINLYLFNGNNNTLIGNVIQDSNTSGIFLDRVEFNVLRENNLSGNKYNFRIDGTENKYFNHNITADNFVEDKRIYYNYSISNYEFNYDNSGDAGLVVCANCSGITIRDLNLSTNNYQGLYLFNSSNSLIQNITSNNNYDNFYLSYGQNNNITSSNLGNFLRYGLSSYYSNSNRFENLTGVSSAGSRAIILDNSPNSYLNSIDLRNLTITSDAAVYLSYSDNLTISNLILENVGTNAAGIYGNVDKNLTISNSNLTYINGNAGIYCNFCYNSTISDNIINSTYYSAIGGSSNSNLKVVENVLYNSTAAYGIDFRSEGGEIVNNSIDFNYGGIYLYGSDVNVTGNVVKNTRDDNRYGIIVNSGYYREKIENNTLENVGYGIVVVSSENNTVNNNFINGTHRNSIYLNAVKNTNVVNLTILNSSSLGQETIYLVGASNNNLYFENIFINKTNSAAGDSLFIQIVQNSTFKDIRIYNSTDNAVYLYRSDNITLQNVSAYNTDKRYYDLYLEYGHPSNITLIDSSFENYTFGGLFGNAPRAFVSFENSSAGRIKFLSATNATGENLNRDVVIRNNYAFINSSSASGQLNISANVTLYDVPTNYITPVILKDNSICNDCYNFTSLNAGNVTFNVTSWSSYQIAERDDSVAPSISFSCTPTSVKVGETITCSCSATDNLDSSPSVSYTANPSTSVVGTFSTTCSAIDYTGNSASQSVSYSVTSKSGGSAPPSDSGGTTIGEVQCVPQWDCSEWSECSEDGQQDRECEPIKTCPDSSQPLETRSCYVPPCESNWECSSWSACVDGVSSRNCEDLNSCDNSITPIEENTCLINHRLEESDTEREYCEPKVECGEWGACDYLGQTSDVFNGIVKYTGVSKRLCNDGNSCISSYYDQKVCSNEVKVEIIIDKTCSGEERVRAINSETGQPVLDIDTEKWRSKGSLNILFVQSEEDCSTCSNNIQDGSEEGVDCGGICTLSCVSEKNNFPWWILFLILILILLISIYIIWKKKQENDRRNTYK